MLLIFMSSLMRMAQASYHVIAQYALEWASYKAWMDLKHKDGWKYEESTSRIIDTNTQIHTQKSVTISA